MRSRLEPAFHIAQRLGTLTVFGTMFGVLTAQPKYTLRDLGVVANPIGVAGVNDSGSVMLVGIGSNGQLQTYVGRLPLSASTDSIGGLVCTAPPQASPNPCPSSQGAAMNTAGVVVGQSALEFGLSGPPPGFLTPLHVHAFRTRPNQPINPATDDLGGGSTSAAFAVNESGKTVGFFTASEVPLRIHAFSTGPGRPIDTGTDDLGTLGGVTSVARGINASGQVVGFSQLPSPNLGFNHAFRTAPDSTINPLTDDLGTLGGSNSAANAVNEFGQVAGESDVCSPAPPCQSHAFRTSPNAPINPATDDLSTLGGIASNAHSINKQGVVVGESTLPTGEIHAYVFMNGTMYDLNTLIPPNSGMLLRFASAINDRGQIAGYGYVGKDLHAYRLDPVSNE